MQINSGMPTDARQLVGEKLAHLLADLYIIYVQTQNFHWNLVGKEFYSLHLLLEKQYQDLSLVIDELAERIRALGLHVDGSLAGFQSLSSIREPRLVMPIPDALEHLLTNQEVVVRHARQVGSLADNHADHATVDFIGRLLGLLEKSGWMVRSQLES